MRDTDRQAPTKAPQMNVHYCEEKDCKEWEAGQRSIRGRADPPVDL